MAPLDLTGKQVLHFREGKPDLMRLILSKNIDVMIAAFNVVDILNGKGSSFCRFAE